MLWLQWCCLGAQNRHRCCRRGDQATSWLHQMPSDCVLCCCRFLQAAADSPFLEKLLSSASGVLCVLSLPERVMSHQLDMSPGALNDPEKYAIRAAVQVGVQAVAHTSCVCVRCVYECVWRLGWAGRDTAHPAASRMLHEASAFYLQDNTKWGAKHSPNSDACELHASLAACVPHLGLSGVRGASGSHHPFRYSRQPSHLCTGPPKTPSVSAGCCQHGHGPCWLPLRRGCRVRLHPV
jgi:hypothetical protein